MATKIMIGSHLQEKIETTIASSLQNMTKKMVHIGSRRQKISAHSWTHASQRLRQDSGLPLIRKRTGRHLNQLFGIWPRSVSSGGRCVSTNNPPPIPLKDSNSVQTRSATWPQVSKSSLMLRGHSIKVLMTRRSIALKSSRRDYDRITSSLGGMAQIATENGVVGDSTIRTD